MSCKPAYWCKMPTWKRPQRGGGPLPAAAVQLVHSRASCRCPSSAGRCVRRRPGCQRSCSATGCWWGRLCAELVSPAERQLILWLGEQAAAGPASKRLRLSQAAGQGQEGGGRGWLEASREQQLASWRCMHAGSWLGVEQQLTIIHISQQMVAAGAAQSHRPDVGRAVRHFLPTVRSLGHVHPQLLRWRPRRAPWTAGVTGMAVGGRC